MKRRPELKIHFLAMACGLATLVSTLAFGHGVGNGGGTWVCRNPDRSIRWANLVDRYEVEHELRYAIDQRFYPESAFPIRPGAGGEMVWPQPLPVTDIQRLIRGKLSQLDPAFGREITDRMVQIQRSARQLADVELTIIDDALYRVRPDASTCAGGTVNYEQLANYTDDSRIIVNSTIFQKLDSLDQAGLWLHEAVYAYMREQAGDTNSTRTRMIVGYLLSYRSAPEYVSLIPGIRLPDYSRYFVTAIPYDKIEEPSEGWMQFKRGHVQGYLSRDGREMIPPVSAVNFGDFSEGIATLNDQDMGLPATAIDTTGRVLFQLEPGYYLGSFHQGLATISRSFVTPGQPYSRSKYGMVDRTGRVVIPMDYEMLSRPSEGLIAFRPFASLENPGSSPEPRIGYMDLQGRVVIPADRWTWFISEFSEGLAAVSETVQVGTPNWERRFYFINPRGDVVFQAPSIGCGGGAGSFKGGMATYTLGTQDGFTCNLRTGLLGTDGQWILPPEYREVDIYENGRYLGLSKIGTQTYVLRTRAGEVLADVQATSIGPDFARRKMIARDPETRLYGVMSFEGRWLSDFRFERYEGSDDGRIPVQFRGKWGVIDLDRFEPARN